ncbi:MAG: S-layer homology domain-containing protein [Oscillospiraceae bacterium]|nr:S-layer homology domain-containing protein [Oscillospiraceae bacterium]
MSDRHDAYLIGFPDMTIRPRANITRAEVATVFFRLISDEFRAEMWSQTNEFSDVHSAQWLNNATSTLTNAGLLRGFPDGTFRPTNTITRAEFAAIVARLTDMSYSDTSTFDDISGHWAETYINVLAANGWAVGYPDGTFRPEAAITRAEVAAIVNRMLGRQLESIESIPSALRAEMTRWLDNTNESSWYYLDMQKASHSISYTRPSADSPFKIWTEILAHTDWTVLESPDSRPEHLQIAH